MAEAEPPNRSMNSIAALVSPRYGSGGGAMVLNSKLRRGDGDRGSVISVVDAACRERFSAAGEDYLDRSGGVPMRVRLPRPRRGRRPPSQVLVVGNFDKGGRLFGAFACGSAWLWWGSPEASGRCLAEAEGLAVRMSRGSNVCIHCPL